jgi:hypothetical protein
MTPTECPKSPLPPDVIRTLGAQATSIALPKTAWLVAAEMTRVPHSDSPRLHRALAYSSVSNDGGREERSVTTDR